MRPLNKLIKFGIVGVLATLIHVVIVSWLIVGPIYWPIATANSIAFLVATSFSYVINTKWSFAEQFNRTNGARFAVIASVGCILAFSLSWLADEMGFHYLIGIGLIVCCVPALTFLSHLFWTYRTKG